MKAFYLLRIIKKNQIRKEKKNQLNHQTWPVKTHKCGERDLTAAFTRPTNQNAPRRHCRVACDSFPVTRNWPADNLESKSDGGETYPKRNGFPLRSFRAKTWLHRHLPVTGYQTAIILWAPHHLPPPHPYPPSTTTTTHRPSKIGQFPQKIKTKLFLIKKAQNKQMTIIKKLVINNYY